MAIILVSTTGIAHHLISNAFTDEIQSTIGIDQDLWCYSKGMDNDAASSDGITFFAWDFAGEVCKQIT